MRNLIFKIKMRIGYALFRRQMAVVYGFGHTVGTVTTLENVWDVMVAHGLMDEALAQKCKTEILSKLAFGVDGADGEAAPVVA